MKQLENTASKSFTAQAVSRATALITGNLGGYVVLHDSDGNGEPDEILIMNTPDIATATKVWRWNQNGLGYSSTGYSGQYGLAMTSNGEIVADFITSGVLNADVIKAGVIQDTQHNSSIDMTSGEASLHNLKARNGLYLVDDNGVVRGYFKEEGTYESHFALVDNSNNPLVQLFVYPSVGGVVTVDNVDHKECARLRARNYGGELFIYNEEGSVVAEVGTGSGGHDGIVYVKDSTGSDTAWMTGNNGNITCVSLTQTSSKKVKKNIKKMKDAPDLLKLEAVSFDYKKESLGTDRRGFIAEDVAEILPNLVKMGEGDTPSSIDYIGMIPYIQSILKDHEERLLKLEKKK